MTLVAQTQRDAKLLVHARRSNPQYNFLNYTISVIPIAFKAGVLETAHDKEHDHAQKNKISPCMVYFDTRETAKPTAQLMLSKFKKPRFCYSSIPV